MTVPEHTVSSKGLSCYTANLVRYGVTEWDPAESFVPSVRLAVRIDESSGELVFSHHAPAVDLLPDGTRLQYSGAPSALAALPYLTRELAEYGRVLVVVDSSRLPWSPTLNGTPAPHWLLVDDHDGDSWHVVDDFTGLLPEGEQLPYTGWLATSELCRAMTLPTRWRPEQERRNTLAFGAPVPLPVARAALWLHRGQDAGPTTVRSDERWVSGDTQVLPHLADQFIERGTCAAVYLEDLWAAAGHRAYAHRLRLKADEHSDESRALKAVIQCWEDLPKRLRFAVDSARRGRPRPTLLRAAFEELLLAEREVT